MIKTILTDIEGTTSALSFVKDILFPYARTHIAGFIQQQQDNSDVQALLEDVKTITKKDLSLNQIITQLQHWIDQDQKVTPLKALQGLIWEKGYSAGDFKGHVYQDAYDKLIQWHQAGIQLYVYSSGSVYAQKLLFGHSDFGDMTTLFNGYYDTGVGHKQEPQSYLNIISDLNQPAEQILFLSDIEQELNAAQQAGMQTVWLVREAELTPNAAHQQVRNFFEINF